MDFNRVVIDKRIARKFRKIPIHIIEKLETWVLMVERYGVLEVRKIKGYHDEPLSGERKGERSIRLSKSYRAFYIERDNGKIELSYIELIEVNKHEY
jgi:proteic killer suppression protein